MNTLNLPKKADKFKNVSFVNEMTDYQKNVFIKNMWENMQGLASKCEDLGYDDVSDAIDQMLDGKSWKKAI